jgi:Transglutaminase-like superfamily
MNPMRSYLAASFGILLLGASAPLVSYSQFQPPAADELSMTSEPKAPGAAAVYLYREEVTDDAHHFRTVYARLKILTPEGVAATTVHIPLNKNFVYYAKGENSSQFASAYSNNWAQPDINHSGEDAPVDSDSFNVPLDIGAVEGRTIQPDGKIVPLTGPQSQFLKFVKNRSNGVRDVSFTLPDAKVGSILEYRYQVRYDRYEQGPDWRVQQQYFVRRAHYAFTPAEQMQRAESAGQTGGVSDSALVDRHGAFMTDIVSSANLPAGTAVHKDALGRYALDVTDVPAIPNDPFAPESAGQAYEVNFFYTPSSEERDFWQKQMALWMKLVNGYTAATPPLQHALQEIVASSDTPADKAKKIYAYVQRFENTDFNANGVPDVDSDWIPRGRVEHLLDTKKGSSNQLALMYLALTRAAGLNARPVRIASRSHRLFAVSYMSVDQLDTVVIGLTIDGKETLADPGTKMAPYGTLHWAHAGAGGVTMTDNKIDLLVTPLEKNSDNLTLHVGTLNVDAKGSLSGSLKVAFTGQKAIELRQLALTANPDAVKTSVDQLLASSAPAGVSAKVDHIAYLDDPSRQLLAVVNVSGSLAASNGHIELPRAFFESTEANPFPAASRATPVDVRYPSQEQEQITYTLAPGLSLQQKPEDDVAKYEPNAIYQLKAKADGSTVVSTRVLVRGFTLLDPKDYSALSDFYQKVTKYDQERIVLSGAGKGE